MDSSNSGQTASSIDEYETDVIDDIIISTDVTNAVEKDLRTSKDSAIPDSSVSSSDDDHVMSTSLDSGNTNGQDYNKTLDLVSSLTIPLEPDINRHADSNILVKSLQDDPEQNPNIDDILMPKENDRLRSDSSADTDGAEIILKASTKETLNPSSDEGIVPKTDDSLPSDDFCEVGDTASRFKAGTEKTLSQNNDGILMSKENDNGLSVAVGEVGDVGSTSTTDTENPLTRNRDAIPIINEDDKGFSFAVTEVDDVGLTFKTDKEKPQSQDNDAIPTSNENDNELVCDVTEFDDVGSTSKTDKEKSLTQNNDDTSTSKENGKGLSLAVREGDDFGSTSTSERVNLNDDALLVTNKKLSLISDSATGYDDIDLPAKPTTQEQPNPNKNVMLATVSNEQLSYRAIEGGDDNESGVKTDSKDRPNPNNDDIFLPKEVDDPLLMPIDNVGDDLESAYKTTTDGPAARLESPEVISSHLFIQDDTSSNHSEESMKSKTNIQSGQQTVAMNDVPNKILSQTHDLSAVPDDITLSMPDNSERRYGDSSQTHDVEIHQLTNNTEDADNNDGKIDALDRKADNFNDRIKLFKQNLQCLKSKAVSGFEDKRHQDTPVVPDLPKLEDTNHEDTDENFPITDHPMKSNKSTTSNSYKMFPTSDDDANTRKAMSNILHEISCFSFGDDSVFESSKNGSTTKQMDSDSSSRTPEVRDVVSGESGESLEIRADLTDCLDSMSILTPNSHTGRSDEFGRLKRNDNPTADEKTRLLQDNEKEFSSLNGNGNKSKSGTTISSEGRPRSGISNTISRFFTKFQFHRDIDSKEKCPRPTSEHLTPSPGDPVKFYSLIDDHLKDRGLALSPDERELNELIAFGRRLQQQQQQQRDSTEGGETNEAFEDETETDAGELSQLLLELSEQIKNLSSMTEFNERGNGGKTIQEIKLELLQNLHLLQNKMNVNIEPEIDSIDDEDDVFTAVTVSDGAMQLSRLRDGGANNDEIIDIDPKLQTSDIRSNDEDNLSLEFFVPGSTMKFRTHRKTFIKFVLKYSIFLFSFLFWFSSLSVVSFGGWMLARESAIVIDDFTDVFLDPYALLCMVGGIIFIVAFFGSVGALRENICLLRIFHLAMTFVFVLEFLVGAILFLFFTLPEFRQAVKVGPEEVLKRAVVNYFDDAGMQKWMDNLQKQFRCCGTSLTDDGYLDWQENVYFNCSSPSVHRCSVPLSCCIFEKGDFINYMCGADIIRREEAYVKRYINTKGCMKSLGEWLAANTTIIAYITAGIVIPQILSVVSARYFISILRRYTVNVATGEGLSHNSDHSDPEAENGEEGELSSLERFNSASKAKRTSNWRRLSNASKALIQASLTKTIERSRRPTQ